MITERGLFAASGVLVAAALICGSATAAAKQSKREDEVAKKLVTQVAGIKEGEHVVIMGDVEDVALTDALQISVMQQGAFPLAVLNREAFFKRYFDQVPPSYDAKPASWGGKLAEQADVRILVERSQDPGVFKEVPEERLMGMTKKMMGPYNTMIKRNVRMVSLGNGLFPTKTTAKKFGLSKAQLEKIFWAGVNTDYSVLQERGAAIKQALGKGKQLHLHNPNGTDLRVGIARRPIFVSDGVISPEDVKQGGPAVQVWLPAGEAYLTPVPGTAEGTLVYDRVPFMGAEIRKLKLSFKDGKLVAMEAKPGKGFDKLKALYDKGGAGKELLSAVNIGFNPDVKIPKGSKLLSYVPAGMVTVGFGGNSWAGGENKCDFSFFSFIPGSTLTVDGEPVIDKGQLKLASR